MSSVAGIMRFEIPKIYFAEKVNHLTRTIEQPDGEKWVNSFDWRSEIGLPIDSHKDELEASDKPYSFVGYQYLYGGPNLRNEHCWEIYHLDTTIKCFQQINECDFVFAYKDKDPSLYGSLVELGFASAYRKPIFLVETEKTISDQSHHNDEFWFLKSLPNVIVFEGNLKTGFEQALKTFTKKTWSNYQDYLLSDTWKQKKLAVEYRSGGFCELCKIDDRRVKAQHVHHKEYTRWGDEQLHQLLHLCEPCHTKMHKLPKFNGN